MSSFKTWSQARSSCRKQNADLASIPDKETNGFLANLTSSFDWTPAWTGGNLNIDNSWEWSDGTDWSFTNWYPGEPNNIYEQQDKVLINHINSDVGHEGSGKWDDETAGYRAYFICQRTKTQRELIASKKMY